MPRPRRHLHLYAVLSAGPAGQGGRHVRRLKVGVIQHSAAKCAAKLDFEVRHRRTRTALRPTTDLRPS